MGTPVNIFVTGLCICVAAFDLMILMGIHNAYKDRDYALAAVLGLALVGVSLSAAGVLSS